jgi:hypothetical protein
MPAKPRELLVRPAEGTSLGVEQAPLTPSRTQGADRLVEALGQRPVDDLLPWLPSMSASGRGAAAGEIAAWEVLTPGLREALIALLGDRSSHVRGTALKALEKLTLAPSEAPAVEALLTRAAADIRRGALTPARLPARARGESLRGTPRGQQGQTATGRRRRGCPTPPHPAPPRPARRCPKFQHINRECRPATPMIAKIYFFIQVNTYTMNY